MEKVPHITQKAKLRTGQTDIMMTGDQIITEGKEDGVCGMYDRKEECIQFWWGNHLEDLGVDGKIIFRLIFNI